MIDNLRNARLLEQKQRGAGTLYVPTSRLLVKGEEEGLSSNLDRLPSNCHAFSSNPVNVSGNPRCRTVPEKLRAWVPGVGQRSAPDKLRKFMVRSCQYRPWQATEVGSPKKAARRKA